MIAVTETYVGYLGNGISTEFPITFEFSDSDTIKVSLFEIATEKETMLNSDYYVDMVKKILKYPGYKPGEEPPKEDQPAPLSAEYKINIYRETPKTQLKALGDKYPLPLIENMIDKNTMILQEISEDLTRAIILPKGSEKSTSETLGKISYLYNNLEDALAAADTAVENAHIATETAQSIKGIEDIVHNMQLDVQRMSDRAVEYSSTASSYAANAWDENTGYIYPNTVAFTDGYAYRCISKEPITGIPPDKSNLWVRLLQVADDFWTVNRKGDLQTALAPTYSPGWETDAKGNIRTKGVSN